jgi:hypothetical protein
MALMSTAPRPETGTLLIAQRVEEGGRVAVELVCGCVLVYQHWLRESGSPPLRVSDILSVTKAGADGVLVHPSTAGAEPEAPMYFLYGEPTLEQGCEAHRSG